MHIDQPTLRQRIARSYDHSAWFRLGFIVVVLGLFWAGLALLIAAGGTGWVLSVLMVVWLVLVSVGSSFLAVE